MDIKEWLEEIGMVEHWEKFEANKIDEEILKEMTEDDLKDIGIDALGDRKTLMSAIEDINEEESRRKRRVERGIQVKKWSLKNIFMENDWSFFRGGNCNVRWSSCSCVNCLLLVFFSCLD